MLRAALMFFVLAIVAGLAGMNSVAGVSIEAGKLLVLVFLVLAVVSAVVGWMGGRRNTLLP
jgi:uncharacterized membrane protein YtjA (UPF0391 family)